MSRLAVTIVLFILTLVSGAVVLVPAVQAQEGTIEGVRAQFEDWTASTALANGYVADPFCVDGRIAGAAELGTMGFHYLNGELFDASIDVSNPEVILVGPGGTSVVAVEYLVPWQADMPAPTIFGETMEGPMAGHGPGMPVHYDLHVWLVDNPAGQFADFNPGLPLCLAGTLPPPPTPDFVSGIYTGMPAAVSGTARHGRRR